MPPLLDNTAKWDIILTREEMGGHIVQFIQQRLGDFHDATCLKVF
jgi:hypothetical protein